VVFGDDPAFLVANSYADLCSPVSEELQEIWQLPGAREP
jgi:hypothetical protein